MNEWMNSQKTPNLPWKIAVYKVGRKLGSWQPVWPCSHGLGPLAQPIRNLVREGKAGEGALCGEGHG